jgi:hypothetical protein
VAGCCAAGWTCCDNGNTHHCANLLNAAYDCGGCGTSCNCLEGNVAGPGFCCAGECAQAQHFASDAGVAAGCNAIPFSKSFEGVTCIP